MSEGGLFDFVLCVGNFSARDEDIFIKIHENEVRAPPRSVGRPHRLGLPVGRG